MHPNKFNCKNIVLLYPETHQDNPKNAMFVIDKDTIVFIRTVNLRKDLKVNKSELRQELQNIINVKASVDA